MACCLMSWLNYTKNRLLKFSFRIKDKDLKSPIDSYLLRFPDASLTSCTSACPMACSLTFRNTRQGPAQSLPSLFPLLQCSSPNDCTACFLTLCNCLPMSSQRGLSWSLCIQCPPTQHSLSLLQVFIFIFSSYSHMFLFNSQLSYHNLNQSSIKTGFVLSPALPPPLGIVLVYNSLLY